MNYPFIPALAGLAFFASASVVQAETLAQYLFTENNTTTSRNANTVGTNVTVGAFANGAGLAPTSSTLGSPDPRSYYYHGSIVTEAISPTSTDWIGFTISATSGNVMNLENLSFAYAFSYNSGTAPSTPGVFDVRSSIDGFASSIAVLNASVGTQSVTNWSNASITLTDAAFQQLDTIEFRIFLNDGTNNNSSSYMRIDTVTLTGVSTSPIPEPASFGLLAGAGGLLLAAGGRRRGRI